jgi:site-specific DNA-methyltransferase (adenine-specific)
MTLIQGDCLKALKMFDHESVDCIVTSPPYWGLRDYGVDGQLGCESTFGEYLGKLCDIFDEVKRTLTNTGTCWVNLGDTYASLSGGNIGATAKVGSTKLGVQRRGITTEVPEKSLCMIPFRFAIEMVDRGWILRNTMIWHKPNAMPSSVTDRFTVDFEYLFLFVKSKRYMFQRQSEDAVDTARRNKRCV